MTNKERVMRHALLARDFPATTIKVRPFSPHVFYLAASMEDEGQIDYFDAGVAAEAMLLDGTVVSTDRAFDRLKGLTRIW